MASSTDQHEEEIHLPDPSIWPFVTAIGFGAVPIGLLLHVYGQGYGMGILAGGLLVGTIAAVAWASSVIREKSSIDQKWGADSLSLGWKLFLISEAAIFGSFFGHYFYMWWRHVEEWPLAGTPQIDLMIPAIGTLVLITSSVTCEFAHKALILNRREACKNWMILTILLGLAFITLQAYEWGYLIYSYGFTVGSNVVGTSFYLLTGFHGVHVITGLLLLMLVYSRLEMGAFDNKRHFSMNAASWYWHFVDVIWLIVFLTVYVGIQH